MEITDELVKKLARLAWDNRLLTLKIFQESGQGGHVGGSFSAAEILTVLYNGILKIDPKNPKWKERDHFILSKGHISGIFGAVLANRGFFDKERLSEYGKLNSMIGMHTTLHIPGCEHPAGSLGHGLSVGVGVALAKKIDKNPSRVFVLQGDGEIMEGEPWTAAMAAFKYKLDNLVGIVDRNGLSMDGKTEDIMPLEPLDEKWKSFGWVVKIVDGHDVKSLLETFNSIPFEKGKPSCVIAKTVKAKGIPFMEGKYPYHYTLLADDTYKEAVKALQEGKEAV